MMINESKMLPSLRTSLINCKYYLVIEIDHGLKSNIAGNRIPDLILPFAIYSHRIAKNLTKESLKMIPIQPITEYAAPKVDIKVTTTTSTSEQIP